MSQLKGLNIEEELCRNRQWEEYEKSAKTERVYVATRFSTGCQHKARSLSRHNPLCCDIDYCNMKSCWDRKRDSKKELCRYKVMYVVTQEEEVFVATRRCMSQH